MPNPGFQMNTVTFSWVSMAVAEFQ